MQDLALLHHWTVATSLTLVNDSSIDHVWQSTVVRVGFRHPYVIQSILSVTALHLAYQYPAKRSFFSAKAAHYHNGALVDFKAGIDQIGRGNSDALFATAVITIFYTLALFGMAHEKDMSESAATERARILGKDWIPLIRGVMALLEVIRQHVDNGPLSSMLNLGNWLELDPDINATPEDTKLQSLRTTWIDTSDAPVYDETLHVLRKCWAWMAQFQQPTSQLAQGLLTDSNWAYNRGFSGPFIWLSLAPDLFFTRLQQRQPQALLLFAHFGILTDKLGRYWWMKGWGRSIVRVVDDIVGEYWKQYMDLPLRAVGLIDDTRTEQD
ncbi:hypothetical protein KC361_g2843 [Hortaea werneckii]|nr:hypothetical protein KC361_g2843 [Hortaea werneckii]